MVLRNRGNGVVGQTILCSVGGELACSVTHEAAAKRADPESSFTILIKNADIVVPDRVCVCLIEDLELKPVKAHQPFLGADPKIAVAGLKQRLDAVLRQAVLRAPNRMDVLRNRLVWIKTPAGAGQAQP